MTVLTLKQTVQYHSKIDTNQWWSFCICLEHYLELVLSSTLILPLNAVKGWNGVEDEDCSRQILPNLPKFGLTEVSATSATLLNSRSLATSAAEILSWGISR